MRGRPPKPLEVKLAEGQRVRRSEINLSVPVPPAGSMDAPADLSPLERCLWEETIADSAQGVLRPLDRGLLRRYCWNYARWLELTVEHREWCEGGQRKAGETPFLRRAKNGAITANPLFRLAKDLQDAIRSCEIDLGLSPTARERIHLEAQRKLFAQEENAVRDEWTEFTQ